jgi:hypothetical protein
MTRNPRPWNPLFSEKIALAEKNGIRQARRISVSPEYRNCLDPPERREKTLTIEK